MYKMYNTSFCPGRQIGLQQGNRKLSPYVSFSTRFTLQNTFSVASFFCVTIFFPHHIILKKRNPKQNPIRIKTYTCVIGLCVECFRQRNIVITLQTIETTIGNFQVIYDGRRRSTIVSTLNFIQFNSKHNFPTKMS